MRKGTDRKERRDMDEERNQGTRDGLIAESLEAIEGERKAEREAFASAIIRAYGEMAKGNEEQAVYTLACSLARFIDKAADETVNPLILEAVGDGLAA